jgi:hypothetical protein
MSFRSIAAPVFLLASITTSTFAENTHYSYQYLLAHGLRSDGAIPARITLKNHQHKTIRLMNITLSPIASHQLASNIGYTLQNPTQHHLFRASNLPASQYIGMNGVPVLDQGQWGTCATFSTTAAIDAMDTLLNESQISQLCNLELGQTLRNGGDGGWQGSLGYVVLQQIAQYGYISKQHQHTEGCGGLTSYPTEGGDNGSAMTIDDFSKMATKSFNKNDWTPIVTYNDSVNFSPMDPKTANTALTNVKHALNQGYRVVFGTLIDPDVGPVGAAGSYNDINNDTWVMTKQMQQDVTSSTSLEGHEIIIVGYDDNACATFSQDDNTQTKQCGLLRIRNSWGPSAGDNGDYYMTYDHFKTMTLEAYAVGNDVKDKFKPVQ